jgi:hypothetical protein
LRREQTLIRLLILLVMFANGILVGGAMLLGRLAPRSSEIAFVSAQQEKPAIYRLDISRILTVHLSEYHGCGWQQYPLPDLE